MAIANVDSVQAKKEHAQKIADLISKCHEGNAELAQARREMKEERERMQTQLAFKVRLALHTVHLPLIYRVFRIKNKRLCADSVFKLHLFVRRLSLKLVPAGS